MAKETLTPTAWIDAGLAQLASKGPAALRAEPLARFLKTTKGSFYWHFKDVPTYQLAVLDQWKSQALAELKKLDDADGTPAEQLIALGQTVQGDPVDAALRSWSQGDANVRQTLADVDKARMERLATLMKAMGNDSKEFSTAAYGSLVGLRQMQMDDGEALIAFAALIDLVLSLK